MAGLVAKRPIAIRRKHGLSKKMKTFAQAMPSPGKDERKKI